MEDGGFLDTIFLLGGLVLIVLTGLRLSRRRSDRKPVEGLTSATIGFLVWLGLLGVALYLVFG